MKKDRFSKIFISFFILVFMLFVLSSCFLFFMPKSEPQSKQQTNNNQEQNKQEAQNEIKQINFDEYKSNFKPIDISKFSQIDNYAKDVPKKFEKDIENLTKYLIQPAKSDIEKARAIWIWITNNITYDVDGYFSGSITTYDAQTAFEKRIGVCSGYASLFKKMADLANFKCEVITGYAKGYSYNPSINQVPESNHAWISINVDGLWYLCDPTWGSGYVNYSRKFVRNYEEFYFCTNPSHLIYTHFPSDSKWQLLEKPVDARTFLNLIKVWPLFFKLNLKPISHPNFKIELNGKNLTISFLTSIEDVRLLAAVYSNDTGKEATKPTINEIKEGNLNRWNININFPSKGQYLIYIFGGTKKDTTFSSAAMYFVDVK